MHRTALHNKELLSLKCQQYWESLASACVNLRVSERTTIPPFSLIFIIIINGWHLLSPYKTLVIMENTLNELSHLLLLVLFYKWRNRFSGVKKLAQDLIANKWQSRELNPGSVSLYSSPPKTASLTHARPSLPLFLSSLENALVIDGSSALYSGFCRKPEGKERLT